MTYYQEIGSIARSHAVHTRNERPLYRQNYAAAKDAEVRKWNGEVRSWEGEANSELGMRNSERAIKKALGGWEVERVCKE